jgi:hypothetical protein
MLSYHLLDRCLQNIRTHATREAFFEIDGRAFGRVLRSATSQE